MEKSIVNESVVKSREIHGKTRWLLRLQWKNQCSNPCVESNNVFHKVHVPARRHCVGIAPKQITLFAQGTGPNQTCREATVRHNNPDLPEFKAVVIFFVDAIV